MIGFDIDLLGTGGASVTTIDGGGSGSVVTIPAAVTVSIDGLTITNGAAPAGGGILLGGSLTLSNSTVANNASTMGSGGGISCPVVGANLDISACSIEGNESFVTGGGIYLLGGNCSITTSSIAGNRTLNSFNILNDGGGINAVSTAQNHSQLTITDSTVHGNEAQGGCGGGISMFGSNLIMSGSTISGNEGAATGGGLVFFPELLPAEPIILGQFTISNSTISGNHCRYGGGGIAGSSGGPSQLFNVTITENTVDYGRGMGVSSLGSNTEIANTIIAGNFAPGITAYNRVEVDGSITSLGHNLIGTSSASFVNGVMGDLEGSFNSPIDPQLGPLQDNGGPTQTHEPEAGSPTLDAGNAMMFEPVDQRGVARPGGSAPDIGAFEVVGPAAVAFCFGDGSGASCPCNNDSASGHAGGCGNSAGEGAILDASGVARIAVDTLSFDLSSAAPNTFALLVSGNNRLPQVGACMGCGLPEFDGLRCSGGGFLRHGSRSINSAGETSNGWGPASGPPGGLIAASGFTAGQTRHFFAFYRDDLASVCQSGQNSSNGLSVTIQP